MSCFNHPERPATAFCQSCGKALCPECLRHAEGLLLCEPCLLLRYPAAATTTGWAPVHGAAGTSPGASGRPAPPGAYRPAGRGSVAPLSDAAANPALAGAIGWIPGVGAMYNGQFIKALIHVVVFVVLIGITEHFGPAGILIAAWLLYQVFDAVQTAAARRDGLPLPDPFGILDMSRRLGPQASYSGPTTYAPPVAPAPAAASQAGVDPGWAASQPAPYQPIAAPSIPVPAPVAAPMPGRRGEPVGAIVLIAVGLLLLLSTLGVLDVDWIGRGWPVLILLLGVWLLVRRVRQPLPGAATLPGSGAAASPSNPFSITHDSTTGPETARRTPETTEPNVEEWNGEDKR